MNQYPACPQSTTPHTWAAQLVETKKLGKIDSMTQIGGNRRD